MQTHTHPSRVRRGFNTLPAHYVTRDGKCCTVRYVYSSVARDRTTCNRRRTRRPARSPVCRRPTHGGAVRRVRMRCDGNSVRWMDEQRSTVREGAKKKKETRGQPPATMDPSGCQRRARAPVKRRRAYSTSSSSTVDNGSVSVTQNST